MHVDKIAIQPLPKQSCLGLKDSIVSSNILDQRIGPDLSLQVPITLWQPPRVNDRTPSRSVIGLVRLEIKLVKPASSY